MGGPGRPDETQTRRIGRPPGPGASGPAPARCAVWGVLNVTPDSFSDGGRFVAADRAVAHARSMVAEGADVIDVGGESSRPRGRVYGDGAAHVPVDEERSRVLPVVAALTQIGVRVSVDTVKAEVAAAALDAGAAVVNVVAAEPRPELLAAVARHPRAELVLMHNRRHGEVDDENTRYDDLVGDVLESLQRHVGRAVEAGVDPTRVWIDPGIGFAKTPSQSVALLGALPTFVASGHRVLVGASRKSFIAAADTSGDADRGAPGPMERLGGSLAAVTVAALAGVQAVRVHDVSESRQAVRVAEAIRRGGLS